MNLPLDTIYAVIGRLLLEKTALEIELKEYKQANAQLAGSLLQEKLTTEG